MGKYAVRDVMVVTRIDQLCAEKTNFWNCCMLMAAEAPAVMNRAQTLSALYLAFCGGAIFGFVLGTLLANATKH